MSVSQNEPSGSGLSHDSLMMLANGFIRSRVFLSAVELRVFTALAGSPATEEQVRERIGLHPRGSQDFLDALVAMQLLEKDGDVYRNSALADHYLDRDKRTYLGYPEWINNSGYRSWSRLTEALRTGERQDPGGSTGGELFDLYSDPEEVRRTMVGADTMNQVLVTDLVAGIEWDRFTDFVDVGGARGNMAAALVRAKPHLRGTCLDLAAVKPFFEEHMATLGVGEESVRFVEGDFFTGPIPEADVMICGHTLHNHGVEGRKAVIANVFEALRPGGVFAVYDVLFDDERRDLLPLMWSLSMLVQTGAGSEYTAAQCQEWMREVGFGTVTAAPIRDRNILVVGHKDR